jgi:hypothetical protein
MSFCYSKKAQRKTSSYHLIMLAKIEPRDWTGGLGKTATQPHPTAISRALRIIANSKWTVQEGMQCRPKSKSSEASQPRLES